MRRRLPSWGQPKLLIPSQLSSTAAQPTSLDGRLHPSQQLAAALTAAVAAAAALVWGQRCTRARVYEGKRDVPEHSVDAVAAALWGQGVGWSGRERDSRGSGLGGARRGRNILEPAAARKRRAHCGSACRAARRQHPHHRQQQHVNMRPIHVRSTAPPIAPVSICFLLLTVCIPALRFLPAALSQVWDLVSRGRCGEDSVQFAAGVSFAATRSQSSVGLAGAISARRLAFSEDLRGGLLGAGARSRGGRTAPLSSCVYQTFSEL